LAGKVYSSSRFILRCQELRGIMSGHNCLHVVTAHDVFASSDGCEPRAAAVPAFAMASRSLCSGRQCGTLLDGLTRLVGHALDIRLEPSALRRMCRDWRRCRKSIYRSMKHRRARICAQPPPKLGSFMVRRGMERRHMRSHMHFQEPLEGTIAHRICKCCMVSTSMTGTSGDSIHTA